MGLRLHRYESPHVQSAHVDARTAAQNDHAGGTVSDLSFVKRGLSPGLEPEKKNKAVRSPIRRFLVSG